VATDTAVLLTVGNGTVVELDAATGKERWTYSAAATLRKTGKAKFYFDPLLMSTPVLSGGMVYLSTTDGQLLALDEATGAERYILELGLPFTSSPAISGNAIFLASYNGTLLALVSTAKEP
jgi:outer membrane protein assembly factor BamB